MTKFVHHPFLIFIHRRRRGYGFFGHFLVNSCGYTIKCFKYLLQNPVISACKSQFISKNYIFWPKVLPKIYDSYRFQRFSASKKWHRRGYIQLYQIATKAVALNIFWKYFVYFNKCVDHSFVLVYTNILRLFVKQVKYLSYVHNSRLLASHSRWSQSHFRFLKRIYKLYSTQTVWSILIFWAL